MDGGGSVQSGEERGAEKLMDDYLKSIGLHRKKIAKDGSCLFRAVAEQVLHCQSLHTKVRAKCVEFLKQNRETYEAFIEGDFEDYLVKLQDPQQWVGEVEINALAVMYQRDFLIFQEAGKPAVNITDNNFKDKVRLCFLNGNHYDSVYPISHVKDAALCQSILYELLYDGVFKVDRSTLSSCQRGGRSSDLLTDDGMNACGSSDESDLDAGEPLWIENGTTNTRHNRGRGRGRYLPERVKRSLNPTLFRNIEYDVWHKSKRAQQKMDYCIAAGMQFTVGDRCQVRLDGRSYNATVKEVPPNSSSVTVYIEELGRKQVPLWNLRPPKDENSWSTVVNRDKRLSNGHGEWEERGKGRGRGKHVPASSSVSQATAPGSSGRVQKQHSWPPQATVEEQGGVKANRPDRALKSVSSVEAMFGLTPKQRSAREQEEMDMALVEIQLRDEHSFPALGAQGVQGDGKKKVVEKKRSQRNKTKSPVEDVRAPSPSAGERPKSSTPPLADSAAAAPPTNTTTPTNPTPPAAAPSVTSDSSPACLSSLKASTANAHMSAATTTAAAPSCAAPTAKTSAPSSAAGAPPGSPPPPAAAAPSSKPSVKGGAVPPSVPSSASLFSFLTPALPAASSPPTPGILSSSSPPPSSSASPPPSSSLPPPTFIAPIAPSPAEAQGVLPRSSPPVSALRHSPSPPSSSSTSSSSLLRHAAHEAPPVSAPTLNSLTNTGVTSAASQTLQSRASLSQSETQTHPPLPPNQPSMPQIQNEVQTSLHQTQASVSHLQAQYLPQSQSEVTQVPSSHPPPVLTSVPPQPSLPHPHLHAPPPQPPHPSQVPHPSLSLSASPLPSLQSQNTQNQTELPPTQPQPDSPPPPQQSHPPHPSHHPHLQSAPPPHPQSIPGAVPLQQLSQLYQDPLYPGFPQGEKGEVVPTPPMSSSKSGDDLPQDVNILRFFFNLGVKSYSMPMFPPYIYLLPLQQAHTMHPKFPSRSPSPAPAPHYPPSNRPPSHQEAYPQYPPTSSSVALQYDHQAPLTEPSHPSETSYNQAGYPVTQSPHQRMPCPSLSWQHHQMPPARNTNFTVAYPAPSPPYPVHQPLSQGYHPGQGSGHPMYPASVSPYPPSSLGYQSSPAHEELQVSQGAMEQRQPTNGDTVPGQGSRRVPGPSAANIANANNSRAVVVPGYEGAKVQNVSAQRLMGRFCSPPALTKEQGESLSGAVLLVDPPLNNTPILVSNPGIKDVPVSMTTMKTSSTPGSPLSYDIISKTTFPSDNNPTRGYRGHQKLLPPNKMVSLGAPEPGQAGYLSTAAMAEPLSVGCSTEDDWDEQPGYKPPPQSHRGQRRNHRGGGGGGGGGGRGRGGSDPGRGPYRRRNGADAAGGYGYVQFSSSYRGRGRERGY